MGVSAALPPTEGGRGGDRAAGMPRERREAAVQGVVQGVGFRPFVYALARRHGLCGWVRNNAEGVQIAVEGTPDQLDPFLLALSAEAPPLARVESVSWQSGVAQGEDGFRIVESAGARFRRTLISPDAAVCDACVRELFDPSDRRYRYPFINCTNCGPRLTITKAIPYDRATTTMAGFMMCPECRREYEDPSDRRFHAQPNACPVCGPQARLLDQRLRPMDGTDAILAAAALLQNGAIVAIKGLGGYHLSCNPFDPAAAQTLRERKARRDKPFALMAQDLDQAREICRIEPEEEALLTSSARPIVILRRRKDSRIAEAVAPRQETLGVMLPYTPLHHLLLRDAGIPLVMTSGNAAEEPIAYRDEEAFEQLGPMADAFLTHNRPIHIRCDDSVYRVSGQGSFPIRRSRGDAPAPLSYARGFERHTLACGGELKSVFCLGRDHHAFLSHHIGDLENFETLRSFQEAIEHYSRLFDVQPDLAAYDLHPDYLSTRYAFDLADTGMEIVGIQHHHAHIASCLVDNERPPDERVIGIALDGTGYGGDGTLWGGEWLEGSLEQGFTRRAHLEYAPMPGGEAAIREPWRLAIARLIEIYGVEGSLNLPLPVVSEAGERGVRSMARLVERRLNTPLTSSAGRLFDTAAALIDLPGARRTTYEGQAAIELELAAGGRIEPGYPFRLLPSGEAAIVETRGILSGVVEDLLAGCPPGVIASRFHGTLTAAAQAVCARIREESGINAVALSGGVFQNALLLENITERLESNGFVVYRHRRTPPNDGGLALGQAALADEWIRRGRV